MTVPHPYRYVALWTGMPQMNDPQNKLPSDDAGMNPREIEESIKRIENDMYYSSDSIMVRLGRIEEKLENVTTKEDTEKLKSELIAHSNSQFRWTTGLFVSGVGVILAVLKLT